jgi:hypothetical protein
VEVQAGPSTKPLHPFFSRDFHRKSVPPPPAQRPRLIAHYSSSSDVPTQTDSQSSVSESGTPPVTGVVEVEPLVEAVERLEIRSPALNINSLASKARPSSPAPAPAMASSKATRPLFPNLPLFSYRAFTPHPRVVYTTSLSEADDLISCLQGNILGFDLEWPPAGFHKVTDTRGRTRKLQVGMTWLPEQRKWQFGQGRTALVQVCDERMVLLIHITGMKSASRYSRR